MDNSQNHPSVRSLDVAGTRTPNRGRYQRGRTNAIVRLNPDGLPVAWRRVVCLSQPGSFASQRWQIVTPQVVKDVPSSTAQAQQQRCHPLN
jgi:hypothetical protein